MKSKLIHIRDRLEEYLSSDVLSFRQLGEILFPIFLEQAFLVVYGLFSVWLLSIDGEGALAAVNMTATAAKAFTSVSLGLAAGSTVLVAQNVGAGRVPAAYRTVVQTLRFAALLTALAGTLLFLFRRAVAGSMLHGAQPEVIEQATLYFTFFCLSFPFCTFYQSFAGSMRGWGKTAAAWRITLLVHCAELLLTALFVAGLRLGVAGVSAALLLSRMAGAAMACLCLRKLRKDLSADPVKGWRPDPAVLKGILVLSVPLALEQFVFNGGKAVSQSFIASFGTAHMAANGIVNSIFDLVNLPQITLRETLVTVAGMCIGFGRTDIARQYIYRFMRLIRVSMVCLLPLTIPLSLLFLHGYGLSAYSNRLTLACLGLIYTFGPLFLAGSFAVPAGLRAGGDAPYVSAVSMACMWAVRVSLSYLFARVLSMGVVGINLAMVLEWVVRNHIYRHRLKGSLWCSRQLLAG